VIWAAAASLIAWLVLLFGRGWFWTGRDDDSVVPPGPAQWPDVTVIIPARDEAPSIAATVRSVLAQDYPGQIRLFVVDDRSTDGTGDIARAAGDARLTVVQGQGRAEGWTGKLWALQQGLNAAKPTTPYILFTDADITHSPDSLRCLVARAEAGGLMLTSLMAKLRCESAAERWFIPAFIYFFQMLYPFRWANDPRARTAAAAGGCVLLNREGFERAGGLASIRGAMIDDCSLAAVMKRQGPIWLGLTERVRSLRACETVEPIRKMVARTAYAQLRYNPFILLGMLAALTLVFLAPPALTIFGRGWAQWMALAAWLGMAWSYAPTLRRYGLPAWQGLGLPVVAAYYMVFTLDSAIAEYRGRGGMWKGEAAPKRS
jgi:hopene-associated glycosyltransferase HpnB